MEAYEHILPENETIDKKVELHRAELESKFQAAISQAGDIIDIDYERSLDTEFLLGFSSSIGKRLLKGGDFEAIRDTTYRSICFALQVSDQLLEGDYQHALIRHIGIRTDGKYDVRSTVEDSLDYLSIRSNIRILLNDHITQIDSSGNYDGVVHIFGALGVMAAERSFAQNYAAQSIEDIDTSDFQ